MVLQQQRAWVCSAGRASVRQPAATRPHNRRAACRGGAPVRSTKDGCSAEQQPPEPPQRASPLLRAAAGILAAGCVATGHQVGRHRRNACRRRRLSNGRGILAAGLSACISRTHHMGHPELSAARHPWHPKVQAVAATAAAEATAADPSAIVVPLLGGAAATTTALAVATNVRARQAQEKQRERLAKVRGWACCQTCGQACHQVAAVMWSMLLPAMPICCACCVLCAAARGGAGAAESATGGVGAAGASDEEQVLGERPPPPLQPLRAAYGCAAAAAMPAAVQLSGWVTGWLMD